MQYRAMAKGKDKLSILGFGCMRLPTNEKGSIVEEKALEMLEYAYDNGVNYFDTAWPYHNGQSEPLLGKFLQTIKREEVFVSTKLPSWLVKKPEDMMDFLKQQLEKLQTDYVDYYMVHALNKGFWDNLKEQKLFDFLEKAKSEGLIRFAGLSFHDDYKFFKKVVDSWNWDFCLIMLNYIDTHYQAGLRGYRYATEKGLGILAMEPLRGGKIAANVPSDIEELWAKSEHNCSPAERGLRWVWNLSAVQAVLSGMSTMEQLEENIRIAAEVEADSLSDKETELYKKVKRAYLKKIRIACSECRYCLPCPVKLPIPSIFGQYNEAFIFENKERAKKEYQAFFPEDHRAGKCIACGECVPKCPRNINIPAKMVEIKEYFGE